MEIYNDKGCKCNDFDSIASNMEYIVVHEKSIKKIKDTFNSELSALTIYGRIILGKDVPNSTINNWAKAKHYYQNNMLELSIVQVTVAKANSILSSFDSSGKVDSDLRCAKDLLTLSHSLFKGGAKTLLFDKGCNHSLRILITSGSLSRFNNSSVTTTTQTKFVALLQRVFHILGEKYKPVRITSGYRTLDRQAEIMCDMLEWSPNMYGYYKTKAPGAAPYIKILQDLYDGKISESEINERDSIFKALFMTYILKTQISDPYIVKMYDESIPRIHAPNHQEKQLNIAGYEVFERQIQGVFAKNRPRIEAFYKDILKHKLGNPSHHPSGIAFDIARDLSGSEPRAYEEHKGGKSETKSGSNPHYHLTFR